MKKWLLEKLGRAFWWVVLIAGAFVAFVVYLFIKRTPRWFGRLLDTETGKQNRRRTMKKARADLKQQEVDREKRVKANADRAAGRVSRFREWVRERREKANDRGSGQS